MNEHSQGWLPSWTKLWLRDSSVLLASQLVAVVITSTLAILIARDLGPAEWGVFSALLGLSLALSVFVHLGLGTWLLRELSARWARDDSDTVHARREAGSIVAGALLLNVCLGGALVLAALAVTSLVGWGTDRSLGLVGLAGYATLLAIASELEAVFRARRELRPVVIATLLEKGVLLPLVVLSLLGDHGLSGIALSYVVAASGRVLFIGLNIMLRDILLLSLPHPRAVWALARRTLPFALTSVSFNTIPRLDVFLIAAFSAFSAGYFAIGDRMVGAALLIPMSASSALYPFFANQREGDSGWKAVGLLGLIGAALAAGGIATAPLLVPALFGEEFAVAVRTVQVMLLVLPLSFFSSGLIAWLYSKGLERRVLLVTVTGGIAGTTAIVAGQLFLGPTGAGLGFLFRQGLFAAALARLAFSVQRAEARRTSTAPAPTRVPKVPITPGVPAIPNAEHVQRP